MDEKKYNYEITRSGICSICFFVFFDNKGAFIVNFIINVMYSRVYVVKF